MDRLDALTLVEGFWNDNDRAQKIVRDRAQAQEKLSSHQRMTKEAADLAELLEMAARILEPG